MMAKTFSCVGLYGTTGLVAAYGSGLEGSTIPDGGGAGGGMGGGAAESEPRVDGHAGGAGRADNMQNVARLGDDGTLVGFDSAHAGLPQAEGWAR